MSVRVMSWVWDHSRSKKAERLVLLAIADCASDDGGNAYPSMAELVRKTGLSERGVQGCIGKLVGIKELIVHRNGGPGGCNRYRVLMTTPAEAAPPAGNAGAHKVRGQKLHPPAEAAPQPPQELRDTPARRAPGTVLEPSIEPSVDPSSSATPPKVSGAVAKRRATRIPDDFSVTDDMIAWARENTPNVGLRETEAFIDYWRGAPDSKGKKLDWLATWRNWMRREQTRFEERGGRRAGTDLAVPSSVSAADGLPLPAGTGNARVSDAMRLAAHYAALDGDTDLRSLTP